MNYQSIMIRYKYLAILALAILLFAGFLFKDFQKLSFHSDDFVWLLEAKNSTWTDVISYFTDAHGFFFRPLTKLYFFNLWPLFETNAFPYHLLSVLLHICNTLLVFFISRKLLITPLNIDNKKVEILALFSALVFYVLPTHVENIVWVSAVTELLPAFFALAGIFIRLNFKSSWLSISAVVFMFVMGLFSHEYMIVYPILILLIDIFLILPVRKILSLKRLITSQYKFYFLLLFTDVFYLILRTSAGAHTQGGDYSYDLTKLPFNFIGNLLGYFGVNFLGLGFINTYIDLRAFFRNQLLVSGLVFLFVFVIVGFIFYKAVNKYRYSVNLQFGCVALAFTMVALLPFLGLGGLAERYLYLPSVIMNLLAVLLFYKMADKLNISAQIKNLLFYGVMLGAIIFYAMSFSVAIEDWKDASLYINEKLAEFKMNCEYFDSGEEISRPRVLSRVGRAWVFQVGYEQGANVYCNKDIKIFTY